MEEPKMVDQRSAKHVDVNQDHVFKIGDYMVFSLLKDDHEAQALNESYMCLIRKLEGRYAVIDYADKPNVNGEANMVHINSTMTVKMNGYVKCSIMSPEGVAPANFPLADIVNMSSYIVFKTVLVNEEKPNEQKEV